MGVCRRRVGQLLRGWNLEEQAVYREGLKAGVELRTNGKGATNPYPPHSAAWRAWGEGFNDEGDLNG